ncbi:membrane protein (plasmid) [Bosea sp. ANAM02]|nr:membrane protein [Bosea sp. ANAM02]
MSSDHSRSYQPIIEKAVLSLSGFLALGVALLIAAGAVYIYGAEALYSFQAGNLGRMLPAVFKIGGLWVVAFFLLSGCYTLEPNKVGVTTFFGRYVGTDTTEGFRWQLPFFHVAIVSRRIVTLASEVLKVNDLNGNPIEIGAAVTWRVVNPASALFNVEDGEGMVRLQVETSIRKLASSYPYDDHEADDSKTTDTVTLLGGGDTVSAELVKELSERLAQAGILVEEARITHLAYAPEIASAMLRRQQAKAIVSARSKIVQGAVEIVDETLKGLRDKKIEIDEDRRASLVSNLLVVLAADKDATPVINAGNVHG